MIYVRDLLKLDTFKDFELVSGENGLDEAFHGQMLHRL